MHNQMYEARALQAFNYSMSLSLRNVPRQIAMEVSQDAIMECLDDLFADNWKKIVHNATVKFTMRVQRKYKKEQEMLEEIRRRGPVRAGVGDRSEEFRNLVTSTLTNREWQVVHRRIWRDCSFFAIGKEISMDYKTAASLYNRALDNLRQVMHKNGVYRHNWREWYYEELSDVQ